jgi:preprotein translocase subunit YajC
MFFTPAYAQTAAAAAPSGGLASLLQFAPLLLIGGVFYFLLIRPQQTQAKTLKATLAALKRGDKVLTGGGIVGVVKKAPETGTEIEVEIAPNVTVSVLRSTITQVLNKPDAANDKV